MAVPRTSRIVLFAFSGLAHAATVTYSVAGGSHSSPYYSFSPSLAALTPGNTYVFEAAGVSNFHPFAVAHTFGGQLSAEFSTTGPSSIKGSSGTIQFTIPADYSGTIMYYCTRHRDMQAPFSLATVEPGSGSPGPSPSPSPSPSTSPGEPSPEDSDEPCFPSTALVTKADGGRVPVSALKEHDSIIAATADGALTTDSVSLLSIAKREVQARFITLTTSALDNQTISLTASHHLPVGGICCSTLKQAKDVAVGETVWAVRDGAAIATTVTAKATNMATGLHSPVLTNGGFPVVDGIVTSFDSMDKVTLAKHALAPLLASCKATGTCESFRALFLGDDAQYL